MSDKLWLALDRRKFGLVWQALSSKASSMETTSWSSVRNPLSQDIFLGNRHYDGDMCPRSSLASAARNSTDEGEQAE